MNTKINYNTALELFKNKDFKKIIDDCLNELNSDSFIDNEYTLSDDQIKLLDITLRTCLMINDKLSFSILLKNYKNISALSHFSAADCFFNNASQDAWYYLSNSSLYNNKHHGFWSLGLNSIPRNKDWFSYNKIDTPAKTMINSSQQNNCDSALIFSSDSGYFNKYFEYSYKSLRQTNENKFYVYHVINPDDESKAIIEKYKSDSNLTFNFEYTDNSKKRKDYYASQRFFIAQETLNTLNIPVFIFDIDTIFVKNIDDLFTAENWSRDKLAIKISPNMELPWQKIAAGAIYIPNSTVGKAYLQRVCCYINMVNKNTTNLNLWWIDQNALFFALTDMDSIEYQKWTGVILNKYLAYPKILENKETFFKQNA